MIYLESFKNHHELTEKIKYSERLLMQLGGVKDENGWFIDDDISIPQYFAHNGELVVKFSKVSGTFMLNNLELTSLKGTPRECYNFDCSYNNLTDLKGGPDKVDYSYKCMNNKLTSIEGFPKIRGYLNLSHNNIKNLESFEDINVGGSILIMNNPIEPVVSTWINIKERRIELIEYFNDTDIIYNDILFAPKLEDFYLHMGLKESYDAYLKYQSDRIKKYYKVIE